MGYGSWVVRVMGQLSDGSRGWEKKDDPLSTVISGLHCLLAVTHEKCDSSIVDKPRHPKYFNH